MKNLFDTPIIGLLIVVAVAAGLFCLVDKRIDFAEFTDLLLGIGVVSLGYGGARYADATARDKIERRRNGA